MRPTELRGRTQELELLLEATEDARAGSGSTVLIEGEAGIGKTRLIDEVATRATDIGMEVRRGAAEELEQGRPFGSLLDALGTPDTAPRLADDAGWGAEATRFLVQDAFVDHVEHLATSPLLLALDDLQWADQATIATLWALARRSSEMGLLLVLAFRPTPEPPGLARVVEGCDRMGASHIRLGPISEAAVNNMALDVLGAPAGAGLREQLERAGGNPFVAFELLTSYSADAEKVDLGGTLRAALLHRFTGLSETARRALPVAAVLGNAHVDDLAALLGISPAATGETVTEATAAGLFEPAGELVAFRHDLIRQALYEDLPEPVRRRWHQEAARRLDGRADPAVVARHLVLGATRGDADAVGRLAESAGRLVRQEPDAAAELLERALELTVDPAVRPELGVARAGALLAAGRAQDAMVGADAVLADPSAAPAVTARAQVTRANAAFHQGRPGEAVDGFAAARATGALDETATAFALAHEASNRMWSFELDAALEVAERALDEGRRLGITSVQVEALAARCGVYAFRAEPAPGIVAGLEAVELAGDERAALRRTPHVFLGLALLADDQSDEARAVVDEGRRRALAHGQVIILRSYDLTLARIAWFAGRWDDALADTDTATRVAEDFGVRFGLVATEGVRGLLAFHRGEHAAARAALERRQADRPGSGTDASGSELFVLLQARLLEASGKLDEAVATLVDFFDAMRPLGMNAGRLWPGPVGVRLALAAGKADVAGAIAADLEAIADRAGTGSARAAVSFARGMIDADAGRLAEAAAGFSAAGRPLDQLEALEAGGSVQTGAGERDAAVACLRNALSIADRLGAAHDARRIGAALRELGVKMGVKEQPTRATHGWESLTKAEREVARLVGQGLRNREIADQLYVSRRTVETHVARVHTKLGTKTRVALTAAMQEHAERSAPAETPAS